MNDLLIPAGSVETARKIVRSWVAPRSNFIIVTPPLTDASPVIDKLLDEHFYDECGVNGKLPAVARFRAGRVQSPETFVASIVSQWNAAGAVFSAGNDIGADLAKAVRLLRDAGRIPVLVIEAFHRAIRNLTWDVGTALRTLEHSLQLRTVVEMPVKLSTLRTRWAVEQDEPPFFASDFGQGHGTLVLGAYTDDEVAELAAAHGLSDWKSEVVARLSGGIPDLAWWLAREIQDCSSVDDIMSIAERDAYDICYRFLKWLDGPGETSFTKALKAYHRGDASESLVVTLDRHDWAQFILNKNGHLRSGMLGMASLHSLKEARSAHGPIALLPSADPRRAGAIVVEPDAGHSQDASSTHDRSSTDDSRDVVETVIVAATCWGVVHGGINSFNLEFCRALIANSPATRRVICVVPTDADIREDVFEVEVIAVRTQGEQEFFDFDVNLVGDRLSRIPGIRYVVGHDVKTGVFANNLAHRLGAKAVVFCHMAYAAYYAMMRPSADSEKKEQEQRTVFAAADAVVAVGPKLIKHVRSILRTTASRNRSFEYLPPLLSVDPVEEPRPIACITYIGRLGTGPELVKQGYLAVTAIGSALKAANLRDPMVKIIGGVKDAEEQEYKDLVVRQAGRLVSTHFLRFNEKRHDALAYIKDSSLVVMPSVHDGFGLVGWEAISLGIPLIISINTGLYEHLESIGLHIYVGAVDIRGSLSAPDPNDVEELSAEILKKLVDPERSHADAATLREKLKQQSTDAIGQFCRQMDETFDGDCTSLLEAG
ncbi:glycosyltransferase [Caballeronia sp. LP003]|uniref:glycosyltransferase n=1 Tax=Caballeronia sp. LP003 TaxID=3038551 RepID=UPI002863B200|nr:glycosyltransferase [Caballeronia sp. LP003]MDR5785439.1 glycosyltransferase [Caballeronia sp. LP003]